MIYIKKALTEEQSVDSRTQDFVPPQTGGAQQPEAEAEAPSPSDKLKLAIRRARLDDAEHTK